MNFRLGLLIALAGISSAAMAIDAPTVVVSTTSAFVLNKGQFAGITTDHTDTSLTGEGVTLTPDVITPCSDSSWPTAPSQGSRIPDGCGKFMLEDGTCGQYVFFDDGASGNLWKNRLYLESDDEPDTHLVKLNSVKCPITDSCAADEYKFCGANSVYSDLLGADRESTGTTQLCFDGDTWDL